MNTSQMELLIRSEVWANQLKEIIKDELLGTGHVNWLNDFPDGDVFTIPSVGDATVNDYTEDQPVTYNALDTGEFQFSITEYKSSALYITKKARQDSMYAARLESQFVPKMRRALLEVLETGTWALGAGGASGGQTAADTNTINEADHRFVGSGTSDTIAPADFAKALYALKKAAVGDSNLIAFCDPSVEFALNTTTNIVNVSNNPRWEGVIESGLASGSRFVKNVFGFDIYTTNYLPAAGAAQDGSETVDSNSLTNGICNIFFSAADRENLPFMGAWRQMPEVDSEYNKDLQREEYVTTSRYGLKVYRPENLVVCLTDTSQV